jgi:hypothetical protein
LSPCSNANGSEFSTLRAFKSLFFSAWIRCRFLN